MYFAVLNPFLKMDKEGLNMAYFYHTLLMVTVQLLVHAYGELSHCKEHV